MCSPHTLFSPSGEEKKVLNIGFLIRNQGLLAAGSLVKISSFWALHSHVNNNEWRFHPPTPHCSSCPLPFLSNLGTQETAEHVLNSTLASHGSISLDSFLPISCSLSIPDVEWGLCYSCHGSLLRLAQLNPVGWGWLSPSPRQTATGREQNKDKVQFQS